MQKQQKIKIAMLIVIGVIVLCSIGLFFRKGLLTHTTLPAPIAIDTTNQPMLGNPDAPIHLVVFEDLKCMNCASFSNTLFPTLKKKYIDTNLANYTMINLAFVPGSLPAANAARCVYAQNPALFFDYIEAIFKNQPPENTNWATIPTLLTFAADIKGIDSDKLAACLVQNPYQPFIENNLKMASQIMNHQVSTPTVYVNGIMVTPLTEKQIEHVIDVTK
ncbi:MAG: thioredoxin domain-containing protein [Coxiellaceae bacterium]|nr:thioredoxin domain-containing protein [Coxiellaceae bacterium]